jgi:hypothetical protein
MRSCAVRGGLALGLLAALSGCATMRHQEALYEEAQRYVYPWPIEQVWPQVVSFVSQEGYAHRKGREEFILVTEWRNDMQESRVASSVSRLYVEGFRVSPDTSAVRIFKQTIFTGNKGSVSARENRAGGGEMLMGAAGDISPFAEDPVKLSHMLGSSADHTPLTRAPAQLTRSAGRDGPLEWKLIQYVDAETARALEARVVAREQQKR